MVVPFIEKEREEQGQKLCAGNGKPYAGLSDDERKQQDRRRREYQAAQQRDTSGNAPVSYGSKEGGHKDVYAGKQKAPGK